MNSDDLRIAHIIKEGVDGEIVIVGSPFDYVRRRSLKKGGEDNGPCCLRRFFSKVGPIYNPQYEISIEDVKVTDFGNIQFHQKEENILTPQRCISKIVEEISSIASSGSLPFVFGGSKQSLMGSQEAFKKINPNGYQILISGKPTLKKPYDGTKLTSQNCLTLLGNLYPGSTFLFGAHQRYFPQQYTKNFELISYQNIQKTQVKQGDDINTKGGQAFSYLLEKIGKQQKIHVSLTVEAIQRFKGCRDVLAFGLRVEQIIQIFFLMGKCKNVVLVDISQFNPSCEDYESSLLLVNLLYYFVMGYTRRYRN